MVTLSPPTSEAGVQFPARPQVGNLVEIHVDFANCFWLDPTGEIMLKPTLKSG